MELIPRGAHHRLGNLERMVRRKILKVFKLEMPECSLEKAGSEGLAVGDYVYYWKPQTNKLDSFRWRGPSLGWASESPPVEFAGSTAPGAAASTSPIRCPSQWHLLQLHLGYAAVRQD